MLSKEKIASKARDSEFDVHNNGEIGWQGVDCTDEIHSFARAIEAEVHKQDEALIRQLLEALENHAGNYKLTAAQCVPFDFAVAAARARLGEGGGV
jgi:hypothetical protein